jgi:uncharacterized protein (TIGR00255 family)
VARSMTGYGAADGPIGTGRLAIEVRTVNHRHFSAQFRLPGDLQPLEADLRNRLRDRLERGHVSLTARWVEEPEREGAVRVNLDKARAVVTALEELKAALNLDGEVDLAFVARQPDVFTWEHVEAEEVESEPVLQLLDRSVDGVVATRAAEGDALTRDLAERVAALQEGLAAVEAHAPERIVAERERLKNAVIELLDGRQLDPDRLSQEIALLADKLDVTEETVRLRTHLNTFEEALALDEPVGRRLAFLGQEMLREINTIGSKANDVEITDRVIAMKGDLEKIREQVENLE